MLYHIRPGTGEPGPCRAQLACPYGEQTSHYATKEEAREAFERQMAESTVPDAQRWLPRGLLQASNGRVEAIEDLPALASDLMLELTEGLYCGRTYAREQAASSFPGRGMGGAFMDEAMRQGKVDREGQPLAYSCWDLAEGFAARLHRQGVYASVHRAMPAEDGAFDEPHAVVIYQDGDGPRYLADPYFDTPALELSQHKFQAEYESPFVKAAVAKDGSVFDKTDFDLSIHHATYPTPYLYKVEHDPLNPVELQAALRGAPAYVGAEGRRTLRVRFGSRLVRATEKDGTFEVAVWNEDGSISKETYSTWPEAVARVEDFRTQ